MRHPPEKLAVGLVIASASNESPERIEAARAGAPAASISWRRAETNERRAAVVEVEEDEAPSSSSPS